MVYVVPGVSGELKLWGWT